MAPMSSRGFATLDTRSMPSTRAPFSAAEMMAGSPPVRQPTTNTSTSSVSAISASGTSGADPSQVGVPVSPTRALAGAAAASTA